MCTLSFRQAEGPKDVPNASVQTNKFEKCLRHKKEAVAPSTSQGQCFFEAIQPRRMQEKLKTQHLHPVHTNIRTRDMCVCMYIYIYEHLLYVPTSIQVFLQNLNLNAGPLILRPPPLPKPLITAYNPKPENPVESL